jgi:hypothetical protein
LKEKELRREKFKDLMDAFKNGAVQKDAKLWFYFSDFFMKLNRKDCVSIIETGIFFSYIEIANLNKEITIMKKQYDDYKKILVNKIDDLNDLDPNVEILIEGDFRTKMLKKSNPNMIEEENSDEEP